MARPYVDFSEFNNEFGFFALDLVLCDCVRNITKKKALGDALPVLNNILRTTEYCSSFSFRFHCSIFSFGGGERIVR
jgi:hypothetical protein